MFKKAQVLASILFVTVSMFVFSETIHAQSWEHMLPWKANNWEKLTRAWGEGASHQGNAQYAYDWLMDSEHIYATMSGTVAHVKEGTENDRCGGAELASEANYVVINNKDGKATLYLHLEKDSVIHEVGDYVIGGQIIGTSGKTGWTGCTPHLHFQRQNQGSYWENTVPILFWEYPLEEGEEYPGEGLDSGSSYRSLNRHRYRSAIIGDKLVEPRNDSEVATSVNSDHNGLESLVYTSEDYGFTVEYVNDFEVRTWNHPDYLLTMSFIPEIYLASGGAHLPEVYLSVIPKSESDNLESWFSQHQESSTRRKEVIPSANFFDVIVEEESISSQPDSISFSFQYFNGTNSKATIIDRGNHIVKIGFVPSDDAMIEQAYNDIVSSFTLIESEPTSVTTFGVSLNHSQTSLATIALIVSVFALLFSLSIFRKEG